MYNWKTLHTFFNKISPSAYRSPSLKSPLSSTLSNLLHDFSFFKTRIEKKKKKLFPRTFTRSKSASRRKVDFISDKVQLHILRVGVESKVQYCSRKNPKSIIQSEQRAYAKVMKIRGSEYTTVLCLRNTEYTELL